MKETVPFICSTRALFCPRGVLLEVPLSSVCSLAGSCYSPEEFMLQGIKSSPFLSSGRSTPWHMTHTKPIHFLTDFLSLFFFWNCGERWPLSPCSHRLKSHTGLGLPRATVLPSHGPRKNTQGPAMETLPKATFGFLYLNTTETKGPLSYQN